MFAYGKNAFRPWLCLIADFGINDNLDLAKAVAILKTAQGLVVTSGLATCATWFICATYRESDESIAFDAGIAVHGVACLIDAALISLLLIQPVKAYWENQSLQDCD